MGPGSDGDDDELVEIELELDAAPVIAPPPPPAGEGVPVEAELEITDAVELRQPIDQAAEADDAGDRALYEAEASSPRIQDDGARAATLLVEVARLAETIAGEASPDALDAARRAFARDPASPAALWLLRRHLVRARAWEELAEVYAKAAGATEDHPGRRADFLVERGRVLEDRLDRAGEAAESYEQALAAAPDHIGALLASLLAGARRSQSAAIAGALSGLARRSAEASRRTALLIEQARAVREEPSGAEKAFDILHGELGRPDPGLPVGTLLVELEALTRSGSPPEVAVRALDQIARRAAAVDPAFAVALGRERAQLLAQRLNAPALAAEALEEAARLDPAHPLLAAERIELASQLGRDEAADDIARAFIDAASSDDDAVDVALLHAQIAVVGGRAAAAAASLEAPRIRGALDSRPDLRALELALAVRNRNAGALAGGLAEFAESGVAGDGAPAESSASMSSALTAAGTIQQFALEDPGTAEDLYRRALAKDPACRPALHALVALLQGANRSADAAELLENLFVEPVAKSPALEEWARRTLVSIYAEELEEPGRALFHQQRLVVLAPDDVARRVRLHDLQICSGARQEPWARAENLLALAEVAGDASVAAALRIEAGRGFAAAADSASRARGQSILRKALADDASGLAASGLERTLADADARAEVVGASLVAAEGGDAAAETVRALRFRLAHHHVSAGRYAEALAALTPLRSEGDPLARAWSYELARRSGEALLEVAVLSEETRAGDRILGDEEGVLLAHAEALARVGDPHGAALAFRRCLALAPSGPNAPDAALGLLRVAATDLKAGGSALPDALRALAVACADDPQLAAEAEREEALLRMAAGGVVENADLEAHAASDASSRVQAESAIVRFVAGARDRNARALAESLLEMAVASGEGGVIPTAAVPLLARAAARARLAGGTVGHDVAARVWEVARPAALAPALSDLPPGLDDRTRTGSPAPLPDTRRARARRTGGVVGVALDLEAALDAERQGNLGAALAAYGSVISVDPYRLEAWTGIRRVAVAGGDEVGEARAVSRLAALVRDPDTAVALLNEAAEAYESAGRIDDAITALAKVVEIRPNDSAAYGRVHQLLRTDLAASGRAELLDNLLSHRLATAPLSPGGRVAVLFERAQHRLQRLGDRGGAFDDFKQILNIQPEHREALYQLARGAREDGDARSAARWFERYLTVAGDDNRAADARLDLAACFEAVRERARAVETLKRAAAMRPGDPKPLHHLSDLHLRLGEWRAAVEALRASETRLPEPAARGALHLRIGAVLRDLGRDAAGAATSFRRAAELDPLGEGAKALVALYDVAQDPRGALENVEREVAEIRRALDADPLDPRRLEQLGEYLAMARARGSTAAIAEAEAAVVSVLTLARSRFELPKPGTAIRGRPFAPKSARAFWSELAHPAASGFMAEIWPHLVEAAIALFPAPAARDKRTPVSPATDKKFAWLEVTAAALGLPGLNLFVSRDRAAAIATPIEDNGTAALVLAPEAETAPDFRFAVGRALGILVQKATVLERVGPEDLGPLFACAARLAGANPPAGLAEPSDEVLRAVTRAISRKDRKALALQSSRFGFEVLDLPGWQEAVIRTAERLGLLMAGDAALAAVSLAGATSGDRSGAAAASSLAASVAMSPAALDLIRFALGEQYPALRRTVG